MDRLKIPYPVIVEGKYDRAKLSSVIDARIITTDGFGIFKNKEKTALLRALAKKTPLIVLTDPDGAGGVIRSHICSVLPADSVIRLYVPRVKGVEKRKKEPSAEGVLGVEGMDTEHLRRIFSLPGSDAAQRTLRKDKGSNPAPPERSSDSHGHLLSQLRAQSRSERPTSSIIPIPFPAPHQPLLPKEREGQDPN